MRREPWRLQTMTVAESPRKASTERMVPKTWSPKGLSRHRPANNA